MNRKLPPLLLIFLMAAASIAACTPVATQVVQQTVVVVVTATPPPDSPTLEPAQATETTAPQATPQPTPPPKPSPTSLALVNIPIEGGDANNMFFARLIFPDYKPAAATSLVFQVVAYDPPEANNDGEGIDSVDFRIEDQDGNEVHHRIERTAHYCAFGGGEPDCTVWNFAQNNYKWPDGAKIESGTFTIFINVFSKDGVDMFGQADFRIQLP
jgi:hypothetical protein